MTGIVDDDCARRQADQALAVPVEPVARLDPTGFDPSRVRLRDSRELIRVVEQRWRKQYFDGYGGRWANYTWSERSPQQIGEALERINPDTATVAEVEAIMGQRSWVTERCDFCNTEVEQWFEIGEEPDHEARYVNGCLPCVEHIGAIAMEARQGGDGETRLHPKDDSAGRRHRPKGGA